MIAVTGIAVGTTALILTLSIVKGFSVKIEEKLVAFSSHMQVRQSDGHLFYPLDADTRRLSHIDNVLSITPFMEKNVILQSRKGKKTLIQPAMLKGFNAADTPDFLRESIVDGESIAESGGDNLDILVGSSLAETLDIGPGSRVLVISTSKQATGALLVGSDTIVDLLSNMDLELATVRGVYETGLNEGFDDYMVIADLGALQKHFHPSRISGYEIMVKDLARLNETTRAAADTLGYPFYSYTVYERYANLFEWLKLQQNITPLLIITITIVAVFNIISTLLVLIIEKTREIGMLMALGLGPSKLSSIFLSQAFLIALIGIALGNLLALGFSVFELHFHLISLPEKNYFIKHVPILIDFRDYLLVSAVVASLSLLFAFIPARVAASLKPGTALLT